MGALAAARSEPLLAAEVVPDLTSAELELLAAVVVRLRWRLLPLLWLAFLACYILRNNLAFAGPDGMDKALLLSKEDYGLASGLFFLGYGVLQVPCTHMAPRLGAHRVLGAALLASSTASMATGCARTKAEVFALRALLGVAEAAVAPVSMLYISRAFPAGAVAAAVATWGTSAAVGYAVASVSAGELIRAFDGLGGIAGWRYLFWLQGLPGLLAGVLVLGRLPARAAEANWLSADERRVLNAALPPPPRPVPILSATAAALHVPALYCWCGKVFMDCVLMYSVLFFLPMQVRESFTSLSPPVASLVCALPSAAILLLSPPFGALMGRSLTRRFLGAWGAPVGAMLALGGAAVAMICGGRDDAWTPFVIVGFLMLAYVLVTCSTGPFVGLISSTASPDLLPCLIALSNAIGHLGGFLGPWALGALHDTLRLGPACPATSSPHGCVSEWGAGTALLTAACLALALVSGLAAWFTTVRHHVRRRRGLGHAGTHAALVVNDGAHRCCEAPPAARVDRSES